LAVPDREYIAHHEACLATHPLRASSYYLLLKARDEESNGGYWSDGWRAGAMRAVAPVGSTLGIGQRTQRRAADWLRRAVFAPRGVSYRATETVVIAGPESEAVVRLHLVHRAIDDDRRDYLAGQDQVERVVMDDGRTCWQHLPGQDRILYAPCWGADQDLWGERYLKRILDNYRVALAGLETVSGLLGRVILIAPKEGHCGPALRLCVDERTGLILRSELRSADGRTGLTSTLSQVRFAPTLSDAEFSPPVRVRTQDVIMEEGVSLPINALARHWASALMVPTVVPEGYVLEGARLVRRAQGPFVHLWYSDGLNVFSLFEGADLGGGADAPAGGDREAVHGSAAAWGSHEPFRSLCWHEQGLKLMLVGDLPREQMLRLARGVHKAS
jgi:negative regulator of sigma E activity